MSIYLHELNGLLERSLLAGDDGDMGTLLSELNGHSPSKANTSSCQVDVLFLPLIRKVRRKSDI